MSINDEAFFNENIVNVNKKVCTILFFSGTYFISRNTAP